MIKFHVICAEKTDLSLMSKKSNLAHFNETIASLSYTYESLTVN